MLTYCNSFYARVLGYVAILTDDYPPIGSREPSRPRAPTPAPATPAAPAA